MLKLEFSLRLLRSYHVVNHKQHLKMSFTGFFTILLSGRRLATGYPDAGSNTQSMEPTNSGNQTATWASSWLDYLIYIRKGYTYIIFYLAFTELINLFTV